MKSICSAKFLLSTFVIAGLLFSAACSEQAEQGSAEKSSVVAEAEKQAVVFQQGVHFKTYDADSTLKNQITEVFWYGCGHCKDFAPLLADWKTANDSVKVRYLPVIWDDRTKLHARIFFLLQAQPNFAELHAKMFPAMAEILQEPVAGKQKIALVKLLVGWGIEAEAVVEALESEKYDDDILAVTQFMKAFEVRAVPAIVVNDKYRVINDQMKSHQEILQATEQLLKQ